MKYVLISIFAINFLFIVGCSSHFSQYKMISQTQIEIEKSEATQTDEIIIRQLPFIAFEEVIEQSPNVKSVTRITDFKGSKEPGNFAISPVTNEMTYQAYERYNNAHIVNLWRTSTSGVSGMTRLTAGRYFDLEPTFTSDGQYIYFSSNRSSNLPKLFRIATSGASGITRITQSQTEDRWPCMNYETNQIFYMSRPNSNYKWQIWNINNNGSLPTQLREGCWPKISNNGKKILYCAEDENTNKTKIWTMNVDGSEQTQFTSDNECDDLHASWSPNGKLIVYASDIGKDSNGKKNFDIWIMKADGSFKTQLTTNGSTDLYPQISKDSRFIYFLSNRGFNWDIWRMEIAR